MYRFYPNHYETMYNNTISFKFQNKKKMRIYKFKLAESDNYTLNVVNSRQWGMMSTECHEKTDMQKPLNKIVNEIMDEMINKITTDYDEK